MKKSMQGLLVTLIALASLVPAARAEVAVQLVVEKQRVYVGEPVSLQVRVEGDESPEEPVFGPMDDFQLRSLGSHRNTSQSITIINGKVNREERLGFQFNYELIARRAGTLTIPPVAVKASGATHRTQPLTITARPPEQNDDFILSLQFKEAQVYVGQPVELGVTWYISRDVEDFSFNLSHLKGQGYRVVDPGPEQPPAGGDGVRIPLDGRNIFGVKHRQALNGRDYLTVDFSQALIFDTPGDYTLPAATVSCRSVSAEALRRQRDMFDDFFKRGRRAALTTVITPSNQPAITVLPLPSEGRPADFSGLVGEYELQVEAAPREVNVGDPITLTVRLAGPSYLGNVELPPLGRLADFSGFRLPTERGAGERRDNGKLFTQTIRARAAGPQQVPPLSLNYFNPASGRYEELVSEPIPLTVRETRVVTVRDAVGGGPAAAPAKERELADNFDDPGVLERLPWPGDQALPAGWPWFLLLPPGLLALWLMAGRAGLWARLHRLRRLRRAGGRFEQELGRLGAVADQAAGRERLAGAIFRYLGELLGRGPGLTLPELNQALADHGVEPEQVRRLSALIERCEAVRFGGLAAEAAIETELAAARQLLRGVAGRLR